MEREVATPWGGKPRQRMTMLRVIVLTGWGTCVLAPAPIGRGWKGLESQRHQARRERAAVRYERRPTGRRRTRIIRRFPKLSSGLLNGDAAGIGSWHASVLRLAFCRRQYGLTTAFSTPRAGLASMASGSCRAVVMPTRSDLLMSRGGFSSDEALRIGLVNGVSPDQLASSTYATRAILPTRVRRARSPP